MVKYILSLALIFLFFVFVLVFGIFSCAKTGTPNPITPNPPTDTTHTDTTHNDTTHTDTTVHPPDSTGPGNLEMIVHLSLVENGNSIVLDGNFAYVGDGKSLKIINIANPAQPVVVSSFPDTGWQGYIMGLAVQFPYAYIVEGQYSYNLQVVNISNPNSPSCVARLSLGSSSAREIVVCGNYAYIANSNLGVLVIDISNPVSPRILTRASVSNALSLAISTNCGMLFVGSGLRQNGGWVVNLSNPTLPSVTAHFVTPGYCLSLAYGFGYIFIADGTMGVSNRGSFQVFRVASPSWTNLVFSDTLDISAQSICLENNFTYIVCWDNSTNAKLVVYEVHNPDSSRRVHQVTIAASKAVDVKNGIVGVVGRGGFYLFRHTY